MKRLLILVAVVLGLAMPMPAALAGDPYPPVVPVGNALGTVGYLAHVAGGGEPTAVCHGRFVLHGSCEVHGTDVRTLQVAGHTDGLPTGNGDEWLREMDIRAYDLNDDNALILDRHCEYTWPEGNLQNVASTVVNFSVVGAGWSCFDSYRADSFGDMDVLIQVDANFIGYIWAAVLDQ